MSEAALEAANYIIVSQDIQIYISKLNLNVRFEGAGQPKLRWKA